MGVDSTFNSPLGTVPALMPDKGSGVVGSVQPSLSAVLEMLPVMARLSNPMGECLGVNQAWLAATGKSAAMEEGTGWLTAVHPDDRRDVLASFDPARAHAPGSPSRSFRLLTCDGLYSVVRERDIWTRDLTGRPVEVLSVGSMAEGGLGYDELQSWGHELRGTLNTIVGWTELVHSGLLSTDDAANGVQTIRRAARQHAETIGNLLESVKLREELASLESAAVVMSDVIARALKTLPPDVDAGRIRILSDDREGWIAVDAVRAQRAFAQVLQIVAASVQAPSLVIVDLHSDLEFVHVRITQETPAGSLPKIDDLPAGALGRYMTRLAYARSFICGSGGRIELARMGDALVFHAAFPRTAAPAQPGSSRPTLSGLNVLLVDDDPEARRIGGKMLADFGAIVTTAASVRDARSILDGEASIDVVVSDIAMPDEDGYDLLRSIRSMPGSRAQTPAIALTAFSGASIERQARSVGFQRCLFKPTEPLALATAIHEVWREGHSQVSQ